MKPTTITPQIQRGPMDCGVVALGMYTGIPAISLMPIVEKIAPRWKTGLWRSQMLRIAVKLGLHLQPHPLNDYDTGIILLRTRGNARHLAVMFEGVLFNPADGCAWSLEAWLHADKGRKVLYYWEEPD